MTLLGLILSAYRVPAWRLSGGPAWLSSESWDIAATLPPNLPTKREELMHETELMLQALIADQFKMTFHRETKERPVYELVIAKGGPKLAPSSTGTFSAKPGTGSLVLRHVSMNSLVSYLFTPQANGPQPVDRPVVDKTGLEGFFDLTLEWRTDTTQPTDTTATKPSLFTALAEQAGLKLEPRRSSVEFLVIDHVERPAAN